MTLRKLTSLIQASLTDDLLLPKYQWRARIHPTAYHCYTASECAYHLLGGKDAGWKPMVIRHENATHWFLKHESGKILDLTKKQFISIPPYASARGCGFLTKKPSKRTKTLIKRVKQHGHL
jgi:hypothetical protein